MNQNTEINVLIFFQHCNLHFMLRPSTTLLNLLIKKLPRTFLFMFFPTAKFVGRTLNGLIVWNDVLLVQWCSPGMAGSRFLCDLATSLSTTCWSLQYRGGGSPVEEHVISLIILTLNSRWSHTGQVCCLHFPPANSIQQLDGKAKGGN